MAVKKEKMVTVYVGGKKTRVPKSSLEKTKKVTHGNESKTKS